MLDICVCEADFYTHTCTQYLLNVFYTLTPQAAGCHLDIFCCISRRMISKEMHEFTAIKPLKWVTAGSSKCVCGCTVHDEKTA